MANNEEVCPAIVTSTIGFIGASLIELISIEFIEEQKGEYRLSADKILFLRPFSAAEMAKKV